MNRHNNKQLSCSTKHSVSNYSLHVPEIQFVVHQECSCMVAARYRDVLMHALTSLWHDKLDLPVAASYSTVALVPPMSTTDVWRGIAYSAQAWNTVNWDKVPTSVTSATNQRAYYMYKKSQWHETRNHSPVDCTAHLSDTWN